MPKTYPLFRRERRIPRLLLVVEEYVPGVLLAATALIISADVVMRYGFNSPITGASEVALICVVWLVYLAAAGVARRGVHINIDFLVNRVKPRTIAIFDVVVETITLVILGVLLWAATEYFLTGRFTALPATGMSKSFVTLAVLISLALMMVHSAVFLVRALLGVRDPRYRRYASPIESEEIEDPDTRALRRVDSELAGGRTRGDTPRRSASSPTEAADSDEGSDR
ncbi:TRAP transporter small permease [Ruicaihuangia caeni]|uniref:TRAP transporter small permease n=1 Tax=Ruicaihuangia caeni TaxID=3042517 RepID=A0AAW6T8W3_9MICO|nr:TRAP transporter small permease [Klugiella sp. YN-L-19]MDI2098779.1 TRAP transporter small permease [Klugiella sp. YN-L-19]